MNATPQSIVSLLTTANQRMVIPVYQRAYSWDEEQCRQLWDDIITVGRRPSGTHFTGSVVMVLGGEFSAGGVNKLLVIDGQQRITTLSLLIVAMAEFAREHPEKLTHTSYEEIVDSGYLVLKYKKGEDHYRLTLSQGDETTLRSVLDHLEKPDVDIVNESHRIIDNLACFRTWLNNIEDPNVVWDGIQRLEIVAITLAQGQDNPQLIFESMNSTGKDLSTADLVRNFVLMGLPMDEQEELYSNYWRKIEETLGADSYDQVFDDFLRNWLTVLHAPTSVVVRDVYRLFKQHVRSGGYDQPGQMASLLKDIRRFAGYYANITAGACDDLELKAILDRIAQLEVSVVNPLIMAFFEDYGNGAFAHEDFVSMLRATESYLFRRAVCDVPTNSLNKFFPSIIARLKVVKMESGNYREAYEAFLLNESDTARRMPANAEFERALKTRDCYAFRRGRYLLSTLENSYHPKNPLYLMDANHTIEHIMPRNALAHAEWKEMLGGEYERVYDEFINNLGNLTLTAYNSELSDGTFAEKKARAIGGFDKEYLVISSDLHDTDVWNEHTIRTRCARLSKRALEVWPMPEMGTDVLEQFAVQHPAGAESGSDNGDGVKPTGSKDVASKLRGEYRAVLEELANEGRIRHYHPHDLWFGTERMDAYLGYTPGGTDGSWDDGHAYRYWVYAIKMNDTLVPTVRIELGSKDQSEAMLAHQELLRQYFAPTRKPIASSDRYRQILKIDAGVDESATESLDAIAVEEIRFKIRAAVEELLNREAKFFEATSI